MGADLKVAEGLRSHSKPPAPAGPPSVPSSPVSKPKTKGDKEAAKSERDKAVKEAQQVSTALSDVELDLLMKLFAEIASDNVPCIQTLLAKGGRLDVKSPADGRLPMETAQEDGNENAFLCLKAWLW